MGTTCTCCRGRRCVRVRSLDEISFDASLRRLRDKLTRDRQQAELAGHSPGRQPDALPRPWEMTRQQFEAAAEPSVDASWGRLRYRGLSRAVLGRELRFVLRCAGGPLDGYRVRVPARRPDLYDQPHRAFVEGALADGLFVPGNVLSDYPDLKRGRGQQVPRLDVTPSS